MGVGFDVVFNNFVVHIFPENKRRELYEKSRDAIKANGVFCASFLATDDPDFNECVKIGAEEITEKTYLVRDKPQHFFARAEIARELTVAGLNPIEISMRQDPEEPREFRLRWRVRQLVCRDRRSCTTHHCHPAL